MSCNTQLAAQLYKQASYTTFVFCWNTTWVELSSWSLRRRRYRHLIPDAAPSHALSGVHTPHRHDTQKWSDNYQTRTRTRTSKMNPVN